MPDEDPQGLEAAQLRERALSRWENEGGAGIPGTAEPCGPLEKTLTFESRLP